MFKIGWLSIVINFVAIASASAVTPLTQCQTIDQSGAYKITNKITVPGSKRCFIIEASNVTLDGAGVEIDGAAGTAVFVGYYEKRSNVEIKNLNVVGGLFGILLGNAHQTLVENNSIVDADYGISLSNESSANVISDNKITGSIIGITLHSGNRNVVRNNIVDGRTEYPRENKDGYLLRIDMADDGIVTFVDNYGLNLDTAYDLVVQQSPGTSERFLLKGNKALYSIFGFDIKLLGLTRPVITGNIAQSNRTGFRIDARETASLQVVNNKSMNNSGRGMSVKTSSERILASYPTDRVVNNIITNNNSEEGHYTDGLNISTGNWENSSLYLADNRVCDNHGRDIAFGNYVRTRNNVCDHWVDSVFSGCAKDCSSVPNTSPSTTPSSSPRPAPSGTPIW